MQIVKSVAGVPIRLTPERTEHIERRHPEMSGESDRILETLSSPDYVQAGDSGTLIAVRHYPQTPLTEKHCCVVYRELTEEERSRLTAQLCDKDQAPREAIWFSPAAYGYAPAGKRDFEMHGVAKRILSN